MVEMVEFKAIKTNPYEYAAIVQGKYDGSCNNAGVFVHEEDYAALLERHDKYKRALDVISRYRCEEFDHQEVAKAALAEVDT